MTRAERSSHDKWCLWALPEHSADDCGGRCDAWDDLVEADGAGSEVGFGEVYNKLTLKSSGRYKQTISPHGTTKICKTCDEITARCPLRGDPLATARGSGKTRRDTLTRWYWHACRT